MEQNLNDISNPNFCENIENKYNKLLLNEDDRTELVNKITIYYQLKEQLQKQSIKKCPMCGQKYDKVNLPIDDICKSSYNTTTFCRELKITCMAKKKCNGMNIKYGVVFNLQDKVNENKKILEYLKHKIIINKNNVLYGFISETEGIKTHELLLAELHAITDTYKPQLYNVLFYTNNNKMNSDIHQLSVDIKSKIAEIKEYVIHENYEKVIDNYIDINKLYKCLITLNKYKTTAYSEQLFKCDPNDPDITNQSEIPDYNTILNLTKTIRPELPKSNNNKKATKTINASTNNNNKTGRFKKIEHGLHHMGMLFEDNFIDQLIQEDPAFIEQAYSEMTELTKLMKYATEEQTKIYNELRVLYDNKLKELNWHPGNIRNDTEEDDAPRRLIIEPVTNPVSESDVPDRFVLDAINL